MPGAFSSKRNFLFDLDGTLIDSTGLHADAYRETLKISRPDLAAAFDYAPVAGRPTREIFYELGFHQEPELTELTRHKQQLYQAAVERGEVGVFDGVISLLAQLREEGRRLFVVTGGNRTSVHRVLEATGLKKYFEGITTAEDTRNGKPFPDPFLQTLAKHGLTAPDSIVIEDAESGVRSAQGAGLEVVLVHTTLQVPGVTNAGTFENLAALLL
jgi:HAD superfamily hydrolase (TIGR01509 family)